MTTAILLLLALVACLVAFALRYAQGTADDLGLHSIGRWCYAGVAIAAFASVALFVAWAKSF